MTVTRSLGKIWRIKRTEEWCAASRHQLDFFQSSSILTPNLMAYPEFFNKIQSTCILQMQIQGMLDASSPFSISITKFLHPKNRFLLLSASDNRICFIKHTSAIDFSHNGEGSMTQVHARICKIIDHRTEERIPKSKIQITCSVILPLRGLLILGSDDGIIHACV